MKTRSMLLAAAVLLAPATAFAQSQLPTCNNGATGAPISASANSPFLWAFVNDVCADLSGYLVSAAAGDVWAFNTPTLTIGHASVRVHASYNSDPFISFGATTTNLSGGPTTFSFLFGTPIIPGLYTNATSTGGLTVTNGARGNTTVSTSGVHPTYISGYGTAGPFSTNLGVDLGTASCNASGASFAVTTVCNQGSAANAFAPTFYDNLEALLTYRQNDVASVASWSGAITLTTTTPEPAMITLFGTGLLVVGGLATRRRRV
ncbi:MAG: PEP-CTERM sorting domain-containing protein [bacterium]